MCPFVRPTVHHAFSQMPARRIFCHVSGLVTSVISLRRLSRSQTASPRFRCHCHLHMIVFPSNCQAVIIFVTPECRINLFSRIFPTPLELKWNCCTFWNKIDFAPQNWTIHWVEVPNQKVCADRRSVAGKHPMLLVWSDWAGLPASNPYQKFLGFR